MCAELFIILGMPPKTTLMESWLSMPLKEKECDKMACHDASFGND